MKLSIAEIHYQAALKVAEILNSHGYEAYIIGGAVRDLLLGKLPKDFDLVTNAKPDKILGLKDIGSSKYKDTSQAFGVTRVNFALGGHTVELEIATYRRDVEAHLGRKSTKIEFSHLDDDIERRDFTINALALDPATSFIVDYVEGLSDLGTRTLRFIGEPALRIKEDPLRILRGIRFKNQLEFHYEPTTKAALAAAITIGSLGEIAADRIRLELNSMLVHPTRLSSIADMDELGALKKLLPELVAAKGIQQPTQLHSEGDVYEHTLLAMEALPKRPSVELVWATLLHDIAKPVTYTTSDRIRFNNHYKIGAQMARAILKRFNFSKKTTEDICWMIEHHLGIDDLPKMRPARQRQFLAHPAFSDLLKLHRADAKAALGVVGKTVDVSEPDFSELERLWQQYRIESKTQQLSLKTEHGIDGHWLQQEFSIQGEQLGKTLELLNDAYLDGKISSKADAKYFLGQNKLI